MAEGEAGEAVGGGPQPRETELRLALVMNGGVSLAVWMGEVTHELDLLRRASTGDDTGVAGRDLEVFRIWERLTREAGVRVSIDIVAGTSAGGLNGLLLATAIGRSARLPSLKDLWIESASLDRLLPQGSTAEEGGRSVLSGRQFEEQISAALATIAPDPAREGKQPVTLFVTATALDGRPRFFQDSFGHAFDVRDHRRVYRFRDEPDVIEYAEAYGGRWAFRTRPCHEFRDGRDAGRALVRAARATASFPAAFAPVSEDPLVRYRVRPADLSTASCVMDGGVLNNAPFGPVLDEITRRRLDRPVDRVLVYVVPSRGRLADEAVKDERCADVTPATVALSAMNYPHEADFRSGTEDLSHRLQTSVRGTREDLFGRIAHDEELERRVCAAAPNLLEEYRRSRVHSVMIEKAAVNQREADTCTLLGPPPEADAYAIDAVLALDNLWLPTSAPGQLIDPVPGDWRWGLNATTRLLATLADHLHERVLPPPYGREAARPPDDAQRRQLLDGARKISDLLRRALAVRDAALAERERQSPDAAFGALEYAMLINRLHQQLNVPRTLGDLVDAASRQFLRTLRAVDTAVHWTDPRQVVRVCLAVEVLTRTFAPPSQVVDRLTPKFKFLRLGPDEMGPLFREDWSTDLGDRKLYGIRFGHFGGFIDEDWRRSDFAGAGWTPRTSCCRCCCPTTRTHSGRSRCTPRSSTPSPRPGAAGLSPVQRMRGRLHNLFLQSDSELIDDDAKEKVLREAGESAIRHLLGMSWTARTLMGWFWRRTLRTWRREQGRLSLGAAAVRLTRISRSVIAALIVAGVILVAGIIVLLNMLFAS